jgi:hypothetical protein
MLGFVPRACFTLFVEDRTRFGFLRLDRKVELNDLQITQIPTVLDYGRICEQDWEAILNSIGHSARRTTSVRNSFTLQQRLKRTIVFYRDP